MNMLASKGEIADPAGFRDPARPDCRPRSAAALSATAPHRGGPSAGRCDGRPPKHEVPRHGVKDLPDAHLEPPVVAPAPLPADPKRVMRGTPRPIPIGVLVEHRLHRRL